MRMLAPGPVRTTTRTVIARDGTRLAVHRMGGPVGSVNDFGARPVIVLANGLGGPHTAWSPLVEYFADQYDFVTWDYRGLYGSGRAPTASKEAYAIGHHVDDLLGILEAEGIERACFVGWSMGVQVCLEAFKRVGKARVSGLILVNGTFGRPLDTVLPIPGARHVVPQALEWASKLHRPAGNVLRLFAKQPEAVRLLKRFGMMGATVDEDGFGDLVKAFGKLDVQAFLFNLQALGEHDASRILPTIDVPVLVVAGDKDRMTPRDLSQQMVRKIPDAEILVVRGGTHYTVIEFPELVNLRVERFLGSLTRGGAQAPAR